MLSMRSPSDWYVSNSLHRPSTAPSSMMCARMPLMSARLRRQAVHCAAQTHIYIYVAIFSTQGITSLGTHNLNTVFCYISNVALIFFLYNLSHMLILIYLYLYGDLYCNAFTFVFCFIRYRNSVDNTLCMMIYKIQCLLNLYYFKIHTETLFVKHPLVILRYNTMPFKSLF